MPKEEVNVSANGRAWRMFSGGFVPVFCCLFAGKNKPKDYDNTFLRSDQHYSVNKLITDRGVAMLFRSIVDRGIGRRRQNGEKPAKCFCTLTASLTLVLLAFYLLSVADYLTF